MILIADDEERDRNWLKSLLTENFPDNMPVEEAHDGQQAVDMAAKLKPPLVFLDIKMPHLGVPHLAFGETHIFAIGTKSGVRIAAGELLDKNRVPGTDGVRLGAVADPPAVKNH